MPNSTSCVAWLSCNLTPISNAKLQDVKGLSASALSSCGFNEVQIEMCSRDHLSATDQLLSLSSRHLHVLHFISPMFLFDMSLEYMNQQSTYK